MRTAILAFVVLLCGCLDYPANSAPSCGDNLPWGTPTGGGHVVQVCHAGYASALDPNTREPRWVAYTLKGAHTLGCFPRTGLSFKVDGLASADDQGKPGDYARSGYDLGHMAPNEDFAWSKDQQRDTFSMANVAPQLPGLNRQGWERLEEDVRAWARTRGALEVYVGPLASTKGAIGRDKLPVPTGFFKVVVDPATGEFVSFIMPQKSIAKGDAEPWRVTLSTVEEQTGLKLPLPAHAKASPAAWPADLDGWRKAHKAACTR